MPALDDKIRRFEALKLRELKKLRLARACAAQLRADMARQRPRRSLLPAAACSFALGLACRSLLVAPLALYPVHLLWRSN